jgi:cation diffusion facilitator family transporter
MKAESRNERAGSGRADRFFAGSVILKGLLAAGKLAAGLYTGSGALIADGWHNLADLLTGLVAWISFRYAKRPPDADHHYGHGNAESLAGLAVGIVLVATGAGVLWQAVTLRSAVSSTALGALAVGIAAVSIVVNEALARISFRLGKQLSSQGLLALARDNRADALSSVLVVVGVAGSLVGWTWAEPVVTALIGGWVTAMGGKSILEALNVLMDRADPKQRDAVQAVAATVSGVIAVQEVRIHPLGTHDRVDMQISVDGALTVAEGHRIAHAVEAAVKVASESVAEVHVHVNPG